MRTSARRILALAAVSSLSLAACGGAGESVETEAPEIGAETTAEASETTAAEGDAYQIGITQIVSHPSLDALAQGTMDAITEAGINAEFDVQNAQGDVSTAASIAGSFAEADLDLIVAIATPTAQAVAQVITDVPIILSGVTDPVAAGLVDSWESPGGNVTGISDMNPIEQQVELVTQIVPDAETIGIVYSSAEENSLVQVGWVEEAAAELGLTVETAAIANSSDLLQAAQSLDVDAFWVGTDNTVVSAIETLVQVAETKQIPIITSDGDSIARGAVATYAFNYYDMGLQTGRMAVRVLNGEAPADIPVETSEDLLLYLNLDAAERMGVTIPQELIDSADPENVISGE